MNSVLSCPKVEWPKTYDIGKSNGDGDGDGDGNGDGYDDGLTMHNAKRAQTMETI